MFVYVLFLTFVVLNPSSADVTCDKEIKFGLCYVLDQKMSATDTFQIAGANGAFISDLIISNTEMPVIPSTIFTNYPNVTFLSMYNNGLTQLSSTSFVNAVKLTKMFIRYGFVTIITNATFRSCISLENLMISDQRISVVEQNAFQGLTKLNTLALSNNSIEFLHPAVFETLPALKILTIPTNKLKTLSSSLFSKNPGVFFVEFSFNQLTEIPSDLFSASKSLNSIYFNNNFLTSAPTYGASYVDLSFNSLKTVQINSGVQTLHIHDNFIETIECSGANLTTIKRVYAANNSLTNFKCIRDMTNLTDLDVTLNKFARPTQVAFKNLKMMQTLTIFNQTKFLKTTAKSFSPLTTLMVLRVDRLADYRNLRQLFPKIYQVGLSTKNWNCSYQTRIAKVLNQQKILMNYNTLSERAVCNIKQTY